MPLGHGLERSRFLEFRVQAAAKDADANVRVSDVLAEDVSGSYLYSSGRLVAAPWASRIWWW